MYTYNPTFKYDASCLPGRSPSPPRRYVEPLSPKKLSARPVPIEPSFNYPAINDNIHFTVRPEQAQDGHISTPKSRIRGNSHKSVHHRTPSTIDTLAEAALALSPSYHAPVAGIQNGQQHAHTITSAHGMSEPPHKRARSEILPSGLALQYASRPATSYEHGQNWYSSNTHSQTATHAYDSRIEEASLLLNFRTGGLSASNYNLPPPAPNAYAPAATRPHANSFPQTTHQPRPGDFVSHAGLLPPFNPPNDGSSRPSLPSPQQTVQKSDLSPEVHMQMEYEMQAPMAPSSNLNRSQLDINMPDVSAQVPPPSQDFTTRANSSAQSADVALREASELTAKTRRGWPRGKPRGTTARKHGAEKGASKKATSRKRTPESAKASRNASEAPLQHEPRRKRRNSLSNLLVLVKSTLEHGTGNKRSSSVPPDTHMVIRPGLSSKPSRRSAKANPEIVCAGCQTTRETSSLNGQLDEWVSCNGCKQWFHVDCAGFSKASEVRDVDKYFCNACEPVHGKTTYVRKSTRAHASVDYAELQRGVLKTSEESMEHHYIQPIKDGTFVFDPETFPRMRPELVTKEFFEKSGTFVEPICIPADWNPRPWLDNAQKTQSIDSDALNTNNDVMPLDLKPDEYEYDAVPDEGQDKLDMVMPADLTVRQVCNIVGPEVPLDVIDVKTQNSGAKWTLGRWADYYEEKTDDKPIRNVISLEVSQTKLGRLLRRPKIVRDIDLQDQVWPQKEIDQGKFPKVQYYCLMSVADSFTDFHIDFGGSSVYYHILKGKKTFFFIPPKPRHLKAYEEWNDSPQQNYTFLPNITKECYRVDLSEGDTMLIPSGWIHAVWTPETSLVIGGNFLNRMSYKNQFRVVEIEKNNNTPMKFRYPHFQKLMWYTAIQYLDQDPIPTAVSELFFQGRQFERQSPVWADFDGDMAEQDDQVGANNTRYYSEAEIEGLPDLCNFIFRTVMLVMGRIDGISADRMKRVNASIPKGHSHGEPLEVAKKFALWVAWKRGNEHPPAWAHPDAMLPNGKEDGPPKKLSARALKEMERKEAIAAWRIAPDRQSLRVKAGYPQKSATLAASAVGSGTPEICTSNPSPSSIVVQHPSNNTSDHQMALSHPLPMAPPMQLMLNGVPAQHISTPKTSVLGPKRVACDACRKRRIRCKHKDVVMQAPTSLLHLSPSDMHDNITVTPPKHNTSANGSANSPDAQQNGVISGGNAYINANMPTAVNGAAVFGELSKRGRSKACFECRKSKRRCIHDESGNVDPVKAAETPVPRGSTSSKKRPADDNTPTQARKKSKQTPPHEPASQITSQTPNNIQTPQRTAHVEDPAHHNDTASPPESIVQPSFHHQQQQQQPPIDPNLFSSSYSDAVDHVSYGQSYSYPAEAMGYQLPSLEAIANEVLDMNGHSHEEDIHIYQDTMTNGLSPTDHPKPDESVDSAVSLPGSDDGKPHQHELDSSSEPTSAPVTYHEFRGASQSPQKNSNITDLPLYRPPPPPSQSPEAAKRQPQISDTHTTSRKMMEV